MAVRVLDVQRHLEVCAGAHERFCRKEGARVYSHRVNAITTSSELSATTATICRTQMSVQAWHASPKLSAHQAPYTYTRTDCTARYLA